MGSSCREFGLLCHHTIGIASATQFKKIIFDSPWCSLDRARPLYVTTRRPCTQVPKKKRTEIIKPPRRAPEVQGIVGRKEGSNTRLAFLITPCAPLTSSHFITRAGRLRVLNADGLLFVLFCCCCCWGRLPILR